jgi:hypothetical protein
VKSQRSEQITVFVNDKPKKLFFGMKVKHAIGARRAQKVRAHRAIVRDADGNEVDVDGALYDGARLYLAPMTPQEYADDVLRRANAAFESGLSQSRLTNRATQVAPTNTPSLPPQAES